MISHNQALYFYWEPVAYRNHISKDIFTPTGGMPVLQNPRGLCCDSSMNSVEYLFPIPVLLIPEGLPGNIDQGAGLLSLQLCSCLARALLSSGIYPQTIRSSYTATRAIIFKYGKCCLQNLDSQASHIFLVDRRCEMQNFVLYFGRHESLSLDL